MKTKYRIIAYHGDESEDVVFVVVPHGVYSRLKQICSRFVESILSSQDDLGIEPAFLDFYLNEPVQIRCASVQDSWCHPERLPVNGSVRGSLLDDDQWLDLELTDRQLDRFIERNKHTVLEDPIFTAFLEQSGMVSVWVRAACSFFPVPMDPVSER